VKKILDDLYFIGLVVVLTISAFAIETTQKIIALFKGQSKKGE
jgi:hypothetical protein